MRVGPVYSQDSHACILVVHVVVIKIVFLTSY
jgi:hypothetical protein